MAAPYLAYLTAFTPRIHELLEKEYITGATVTFPVREPRAGKAAVHFTGHGILVSMGDRFSSKFIESWDAAPMLYDIATNDNYKKLWVFPCIEAFMKQCATIEIEVTKPHLVEIIENHYVGDFETVTVGSLTSPSRIHM